MKLCGFITSVLPFQSFSVEYNLTSMNCVLFLQKLQLDQLRALTSNSQLLQKEVSQMKNKDKKIYSSSDDSDNELLPGNKDGKKDSKGAKTFFKHNEEPLVSIGSSFLHSSVL